jgi:hypothetical protein
MAMRCIWVATSPECTTHLFSHNTCEMLNNILAALEHNDRVRHIFLGSPPELAVGKGLGSNINAEALRRSDRTAPRKRR